MLGGTVWSSREGITGTCYNREGFEPDRHSSALIACVAASGDAAVGGGKAVSPAVSHVEAFPGGNCSSSTQQDTLQNIPGTSYVKFMPV